MREKYGAPDRVRTSILLLAGSLWLYLPDVSCLTITLWRRCNYSQTKRSSTKPGTWQITTVKQFTVYFRKSAMFAFDHKQKKYKYYGEDNTIQYKQRIMKLWFSVLHLLNTNESIANTLKWTTIFIIIKKQR